MFLCKRFTERVFLCSVSTSSSSVHTSNHLSQVFPTILQVTAMSAWLLKPKGTFSSGLLKFSEALRQVCYLLYYFSKPGLPFSCLSFVCCWFLVFLSQSSFCFIKLCITTVHHSFLNNRYLIACNS